MKPREKVGIHALVIPPLDQAPGATMDQPNYVQNPDVNVAEEDQDGALLFNPDTDQVQLINDSGLFIWKLCAQGHTTDQIVAAIKAEFDGVPDDQVESDVQAFVQPMLEAGFLGTLVTS